MHHEIPFKAITLFISALFTTGAVGDEAASRQFRKLLDDSWEFEMDFDPLWAMQVGDHRNADKLPRVRVEDYERRLAAKRGFRKRLNDIDASDLTHDERINYRIFERILDEDIKELELDSFLIPITNRSGFHIEFPNIHRKSKLATVEDYEKYIARLGTFAQYAQDHIELMRAGVKKGMVLPAVVLEGYQGTLRPHIVEDAAKSLLYKPLKDFPESFSADDRERLSAAARKAISESVVRGYREFLEFLKSEYVPAARASVGASALPKGREFYRFRVRRFTTLDLLPEEVHQRGLGEVKRIRAEMDEVIEETEFNGDFAKFVDFLRTDPRFYPKTPDELMKEVALALKKMDGQLPRLFKTLPRAPYGIRKVPDYVAPLTTTAYYVLPAGDGTRAGFYYVNTYNLKTRPLYEVEALSLHEAVPGHHLQLALQQEMSDMPDFRRYAGFTVFVEGWALYAERLGLEVGFYEDPYSNFGRLSYEMWRACRLVVDTGIHYFGWSRQKAIDYMAANTSLSLHNITAEIDRYIAWPGQALAYKIGELKIRELRKFAEQELGKRFDLREFHDVVLGSGSVPLEVLEENVRAFVSGSAKR